MQISSVTPGYTVDSYTTIEPFVKLRPMILLALSTGAKFGVLSELIGVGTVII